MPVRHVLVVDDSKSARLMLRKMLQGLGLTVDTADSAEEALSYLHSQKPDAIFMDHTMPGMDGLTALRQIHSRTETAAIPVAMYTSKDDPAYQDEARAAGAISVLTKPATPEALSALLEQMHALLDAAAHTGPALAAVEAGVSAEWVEKLITEKSERLFYDAVESQVLPLINDVVAKLRLELELSQEDISSRIAAQMLETRLATWQPSAPEPMNIEGPVETALRTQLPSLVEEQLKTFQQQGQADHEKRVREIANQVCKSELHEFSGQLVRQLSTRFTDAVRKMGASARDQAVDAARESALTAAREVALQAIADAKVVTSANAEESPTAAAQRAARDLWTEAQRSLRQRIYWTAGAAAALGMGAALLVYGLR